MGDIAQCIQITDKLLRCNTPETNLVININIRVTLVTSLHPEPGELFFGLVVGVLRLLSFRCGTAASFITEPGSVSNTRSSLRFSSISALRRRLTSSGLRPPARTQSDSVAAPPRIWIFRASASLTGSIHGITGPEYTAVYSEERSRSRG